MPELRTVHSIPAGHGEFQKLYLDTAVQPRWLRPNLIFVRSDGSVDFETNELGLKGGPVDRGRRKAVVWGDSVVFGCHRSWPEMLDQLFPRYQFLNGGIEGDGWNTILQRADKLNREFEIALNLLMLGWHHYNEGLREALRDTLSRLRNPVMLTMPTPLNRRNFDQDISAYLGDDVAVIGTIERGFWFYGGAPYSVELQLERYEYITTRNAIAREVAAQLGVPVIDLFTALDSEGLADFRQDFYDLMHPRPSAYPKWVRVIAEELRRVCRHCIEPGLPERVS